MQSSSADNASQDFLQKVPSGFLVNDVLDRDRSCEFTGGVGKTGQKTTVNKKGSLSGVFVPTCENMWGVLIFLRFYYIVGQAGVLQTLCIVCLSFTVALCTTASMSSIASSGGIVSAGGPYHMISRALGPVVGATVGIMYWLAITMLAVLECLGAVESLVMAWPEMHFPWHMQVLGSIFMLILALVVWAGISVVTKLGLFFAVVVLYTLFSYYYGLATAPHAEYNPMITGLSFETLELNWGSHYSGGEHFGSALALFYPCFTGILSGANRADVLRDPPKDIRRGTYAAIIFSFFLYCSMFIMWGSCVDYNLLRGDVSIVKQIVWNPFPASAFTGIIIASLSQALQCLIVAPRLLQRIAQDDILWVLQPLSPLSKRGEPVRALLFTYVVAGALVLIGNLDLVAPLLSMCFLVAYAFMNCSCFALTVLKSPAWRPDWIGQKRWRMWYLFLAGLGFALCVTVMFTINWRWALAANSIALALYAGISLKIQARDWGSAWDGIRHQLAVKSLLGLEASQQQCVNWRPQMLILYKMNVAEELAGIKHHEILRFSAQLRKSRGFCVVACVLESDRRDADSMRRASEERAIIRGIMKEEGIEGFAEVVVAPNYLEGTSYIIQLTGIGGLVPNTVVLDWPECGTSGITNNEQAGNNFVEILQTALAAEKSVLAVKGLQNMPTQREHGTIDIWWMIHDGGFMILLSWLLSKHRIWRGCHLRVFTVAENVSAERAQEAAKILTRTLRQSRLVDVDVEVILLDDDMIEPYTHDWTLRVEHRHQFLQQLTPYRSDRESVPFEIDDLFAEDHADEGPEGSAIESLPESEQGEIKVSDCRTRVDVETRRHDLGGRSGTMRSTTNASFPPVPEANAIDASKPFGICQANCPFKSVELCAALGQIINSRSKRAQLVVMNLPDPWGTGDCENQEYMQYCGALTQGLDRVLFVHSTGREVFDFSD